MRTRTFAEYVAEKDNAANLIEQTIAKIAVEAESNPELKQLLDEAGFFGNLWNAAKQFGQGIWSGGGIKPGAQAAWSAMTGPETQIKNALGALNKAYQQMANDKTGVWQQSSTTGMAGKAMPLVNWLKETIAELDSQVKQFNNRKVQPGQNAQGQVAQPAPGNTMDPAGTKHI